MTDKYHKQQYEAALRSADLEPGEGNIPAWEDLTEEQKENIRKVNLQHDRFMDRLGNAIANGTELPNPLED